MKNKLEYNLNKSILDIIWLYTTNLEIRKHILIPFCEINNLKSELDIFTKEFLIYHYKLQYVKGSISKVINKGIETSDIEWYIDKKSIIIEFDDDNIKPSIIMNINNLINTFNTKLDMLLNTEENETMYNDFISEALSQYNNLIMQTNNYSDRQVLSKEVTLQVTDQCNLKCSYCYQINKGKRYMDIDTAKKIIDLLLNQQNNVNKYVDIYKTPALVLDYIGGEPLLAPKLIKESYEYFLLNAIKNHSIWAVYHRISVTSNGTLYFDKDARDFLITYRSAISLAITIDGNKELHDSCRKFENGEGSYDKAIAAVDDWQSMGFFMGSKITLSPYNLSYMNDAIEDLYKRNYHQIWTNVVFEKGWTIDHAREYYIRLKQLADNILNKKIYFDFRCTIFNYQNFCPLPASENDNWCGGLGDMLAFDPDGVAYPCLRYMESSVGTGLKQLRIGDSSGLLMTKEEEDLINDMKSVTRKSQSTDECFNCPIAKGCAWCSGYNYQEFGTYNKRATFICDMHRAESLANVYFWNKVFDKEDIPYKFNMYIEKDKAVNIIGEDEYNYLLSLISDETKRIINMQIDDEKEKNYYDSRI